jgi:hypothetical protein
MRGEAVKEAASAISFDVRVSARRSRKEKEKLKKRRSPSL